VEEEHLSWFHQTFMFTATNLQYCRGGGAGWKKDNILLKVILVRIFILLMDITFSSVGRVN
jgi:hypothetical protein